VLPIPWREIAVKYGIGWHVADPQRSANT